MFIFWSSPKGKRLRHNAPAGVRTTIQLTISHDVKLVVHASFRYLLLLASVGTTPHTMLVGFLAVWFVMLIYSSACAVVSFVKHVIRRDVLFLPPFKGLFREGLLILYKVWTIQDVFLPTSCKGTTHFRLNSDSGHTTLTVAAQLRLRSHNSD